MARVLFSWRVRWFVVVVLVCWAASCVVALVPAARVVLSVLVVSIMGGVSRRMVETGGE